MPDAVASPDVAEYALRLGDDALIAAQRLVEWSSLAPELEEDMALSNIALDQLGVARLLLTYAGSCDGTGRDEDDLAFQRDDAQFRNCLLVELPNAGPNAAPSAPGDFGATIAKLLFLSAYQLLSYERLVDLADTYLADVAAKARKESAYHVDHAALWTVRLGDGTEESHRRMQSAVDEIWPFTHELFAADDLMGRLVKAGVAPDPSEIHPLWSERMGTVFAQATLTRPADGWAPSGGRVGRHTEHLSYLLGEMQVVHRAYPGARW
jgi:ring-1,2-phenylacetyl-CoA epoxidase subunit PaaC